MKASELMSRNLITFYEEDSILTVMEVFTHAHISGAPVITMDNQFIGFFSKSDITSHKIIDYLKQDGDLKRLQVREVMDTSPLVTVSEEAEVEDVAAALIENNVHRVLVKDKEGQIAGLISSMDITRNYALQALSTRLKGDIFVEALDEVEKEILRLIILGKTTHEMASIFHTQPDSVNQKVGSILQKLSVKNVTQAATLAIEMKLID